MQFSQPINNSYFSEQQSTYPTPLQYPNVVGEGDVASLISPDGSVHYYFFPLGTRERRLFNPFCPTFPSGNPASWPFTEAWLIRRVSTPVVPSIPHDMTTNMRDPFLKSYYASKNMDTDWPQPNGFHQKFHNDNVTSTTDIHYFYPKQRQNSIKYSTGVQVDTPLKSKKSTQYEISSKGSPTSNIKTTRFNKNTPYTMDSAESAMSVDESNFKHCCGRKQTTSFRHRKRGDNTNTTKRCRRESKRTDKIVSTCSDQGSNYADTSGRETQTVEKVSRSLSKALLSDVQTATSCESCCQTCDCHDTTESDSDK